MFTQPHSTKHFLNRYLFLELKQKYKVFGFLHLSRDFNISFKSERKTNSYIAELVGKVDSGISRNVDSVHRCGGADRGKHRKTRGNKSTDGAGI